MWHTLLHSTDLNGLIEILKSNKLGYKFETKNLKFDTHLIDNKVDKFYNDKEVIFTNYLSSELTNLIGNKNWLYKKDIIIGINPDVLNNYNWIMCKSMKAGNCVIYKSNIVVKSDKLTKPNYEKINNFINSRLEGFKNKKFLKKYVKKRILYLNKELNEININDDKRNNYKKILDEINVLNNLDYNNETKLNKIINKYFYTNIDFIDTHEIVFLERLNIENINFIIINLWLVNIDTFEKINKLLPNNIKIILNIFNVNKKILKELLKTLSKNIIIINSKDLIGNYTKNTNEILSNIIENKNIISY